MFSKVGMSMSYGWSGTQQKSENELPKFVTNKYKLMLGQLNTTTSI